DARCLRIQSSKFSLQLFLALLQSRVCWSRAWCCRGTGWCRRSTLGQKRSTRSDDTGPIGRPQRSKELCGSRDDTPCGRRLRSVVVLLRLRLLTHRNGNLVPEEPKSLLEKRVHPGFCGCE